MKRNFIILIVAGLIIGCTNLKKTDLDELNLKSNVQSVFTLSYEAIDKFGEGDIVKGKLNSSGNEFICFDSIGNTISKIEYFIQEIIDDYRYEYDGNGYKIKDLQYDENGKLYSWSSTFVNDSAGKPLIKTEKDGDKTYYTYDKNGRLVKEKEDYSYETYEYDINGNLIESKRYVTLFNRFLGNSPPTIYKYYYDSNNNQIRTERKDWYRESKYDEKNLETESISYKDNKIERKAKYCYNDKGDMVRIVVWNEEGVLVADQGKIIKIPNRFLFIA